MLSTLYHSENVRKKTNYGSRDDATSEKRVVLFVPIL